MRQEVYQQADVESLAMHWAERRKSGHLDTKLDLDLRKRPMNPSFGARLAGRILVS